MEKYQMLGTAKDTRDIIQAKAREAHLIHPFFLKKKLLPIITS